MEFLPEFFFSAWMGRPAWVWVGFLVIVAALMILDLGIMHKPGKVIDVRESIVMCAFYTALGLAFAAVIYWIYSQPMSAESIDGQFAGLSDHKRAMMAAQLYVTGYLVELSLSMDNVFVISLIFGYFHIPRQHQHRVLFWGIIGVILFRAALIGVGAALISQFSWVMSVFGVFLVYAGVKMMRASEDHNPDIANNPVLRYIRGHFPVTHDLHGESFFIRQTDPKTGRMLSYMTPLFLALVMVELADVVFAVDSVPAIFAITPDSYLVYTSNIFAILGLRSLYFTLAAMVHRFHYMKYALALILVLIGAKILVAELGGLHLPNWVSLAATVGLLAGGIGYSLLKTRAAEKAASL
ncbi:MAG: TerC family protein [Alphaproteobacteria bacterium]